jgi:hypothetical protein
MKAEKLVSLNPAIHCTECTFICKCLLSLPEVDYKFQENKDPQSTNVYVGSTEQPNIR